MALPNFERRPVRRCDRKYSGTLTVDDAAKVGDTLLVVVEVEVTDVKHSTDKKLDALARIEFTEVVTGAHPLVGSTPETEARSFLATVKDAQAEAEADADQLDGQGKLGEPVVNEDP